jgi:hypothetical protein
MFVLKLGVSRSLVLLLHVAAVVRILMLFSPGRGAERLNKIHSA